MLKIRIVVLLIFCILFVTFFSCFYNNTSLYPIELGKKWSKIELPSYNSGFANIKSLFVSADGSLMYAIHRYGYFSPELFISENSGQTWKKSEIKDIYEFKDSAFSQDGSVMYFIAELNINIEYNNYLIKSTDKGKSYKILKNNLSHFDHVACSANGNIVLVSNYDYSSNKTDIFISKDGTNFSGSVYQFPDKVTLLKVSPSGKIIVIGLNDGRLYISKDTAVTFNELTQYHNAYKDVAFSDDSSNIFILSSNEIIYSSNYGNNFNKLNTISFSNYNSIDVSSNANFIYIAAYNGYIYKSADNGLTWNSIIIPGKKTFTHISCSSNGSKILIGSDSDTFSLINSKDYLNTYSYCDVEYLISTIKFKFKCFSKNANTMILFLKSFYITKTEDSGNSWQVLKQTDFYDIKKVSSDSECNLLALINDKDIYISKDKAFTWIKVQEAANNDWQDIVVSYDGNTIVAIAPHMALISRDSGNNWETINFNIDLLKRCWVSDYGDTIFIAGTYNIFLAKSKTNIFESFNYYFKPAYFGISNSYISRNGNTIVFPSGINSDLIIFTKDCGKTWHTDSTLIFLQSAALSKDGRIFIGVEYYDGGSVPYSNSGFIHLFNNNFDSHTILANYGTIDSLGVLISDDNSLIFIFERYKLYLSTNEGKDFYTIDILNDPYNYPPEITGNIFLTSDKKKLIIFTYDSLYISTSK